MRLIFAGTPEPAVVALERLLKTDHEVVAVLTRPDARRGRGRTLHPSPVSALAQEHGIEVLTPTTLKAGTEDGDAIRTRLAELAPDAIPVVAYGNLVPKDLLDLPTHGWVNLHFSLLPAWRGAAPVQAAIRAGDDITGAATFRIEEGLRMARRFLLRVAEIGLPAGTELLDTLIPQYIGDLVSWAAIGARTAEAQTHRELASGSSMPVGFKNGTDGSIDTALNGMQSALGPHHFLGVTADGLPAVFCTTGNPHPHLVLRGGRTPNYDEATLRDCAARLEAKHLPRAIIVDCSHANSAKKPERQAVVLDDILGQLERGNGAIRGFMLESNLEPGSQPIPQDLSTLNPRVSVTDACIGWDDTVPLLEELAEAVRQRRLVKSPDD